MHAWIQKLIPKFYNLVPIQGGWTSWINTSPCSSVCADGTNTRERSCTKPTPAYGGEECIGDFRDIVQCGSNSCGELIKIKNYCYLAVLTYKQVQYIATFESITQYVNFEALKITIPFEVSQALCTQQIFLLETLK